MLLVPKDKVIQDDDNKAFKDDPDKKKGKSNKEQRKCKNNFK